MGRIFCLKVSYTCGISCINFHVMWSEGSCNPFPSATTFVTAGFILPIWQSWCFEAISTAKNIAININQSLLVKSNQDKTTKRTVQICTTQRLLYKAIRGFDWLLTDSPVAEISTTLHSLVRSLVLPIGPLTCTRPFLQIYHLAQFLMIVERVHKAIALCDLARTITKKGRC